MRKVRWVILFVGTVMKTNDDVLVWRIDSERLWGDWVYVTG